MRDANGSLGAQTGRKLEDGLYRGTLRCGGHVAGWLRLCRCLGAPQSGYTLENFFQASMSAGD